MPYRILTDSDLADVLQMSDAVACMEDAFRQKAASELVAPGRMTCQLQAGQLVFTAGATQGADPVVGFRVYDMKQLHSPDRDEITAVFSGKNGALRGLVIGTDLGAVRTGAIGGVAVKYLARSNAKVLGMIGTGFQARTQLQAASSVRDFETIKVYSRNSERRKQFADEMGQRLNRKIHTVDSSEQATRDADVLIASTTSSRPLVEADWLKPGVHIQNVGPKFKDRHEFSLDVAERAQRRVTDSPAQMEAYGEQFILQGTKLVDSVVDLAEIVTGTVPGRDSEEEITLFYSLGLAGTEVLLADSLF